MNLLSGQGLQVVLNGRPVLAGVDVDFVPGQVTGLIGANGAGKTTLLRSLAGLQPLRQGQALLEGQPIVVGLPLARRMAYLEQRPSSQWSLKVEDMVMLGRMPHIPWGQDPSTEDAAAVGEALRDTDALALRGEPLHRLSGGEQARVFLARALAGRPEWLLADEPVAGLDPSQQLRVMAVLRQKAAQGMGIIVTLHDLTLARRFCDRLVLLHQGRIQAQGAPDTVVEDANLAESYGLFAHRGHFREEGFLVPWEAVGKG